MSYYASSALIPQSNALVPLSDFEKERQVMPYTSQSSTAGELREDQKSQVFKDMNLFNRLDKEQTFENKLYKEALFIRKQT